MAGIIERIQKALPGYRGPTSVAPTATAGREIDEADLQGGYVVQREARPQLRGKRRWIEYEKLVTETLIVAASVRYFLAMIANANWTVQPPKDENGDPLPGSEDIAKFVESCMDDMDVSWSRVIKRAALFRFNGFGIQEWTSKPGKAREDGRVGMKTVQSRPCHTIERWDIDENDGSTIKGVTQYLLASGEAYIPRNKFIYLVDDALTTNPEGTGLFRHLYRGADRLRAIEELEDIAFETDLRGVPVGRVPLAELKASVDAGTLTLDKVKKARAAVDNFVKNKLLNKVKGLILDSETFLAKTADGNTTPSAVRKWDVELLKGEAGPHQAAAEAVNRINREMAVLLGTEHLLLGGDGTGSLALGKSKLDSFFLIVTSTLGEIAEAYNRDWVAPLCRLNGIKQELWPKLQAEDIDVTDIEIVASALSSLATAGAMLTPDDPAIDEVRGRMGLPPAPPPPELSPAESALVDRVRTAGVDPNAIKEYKPVEPKPEAQPAKGKGQGQSQSGSGGAKAELKKLLSILGLSAKDLEE